MSDPVSNAEVEDVLSSIRRLVSEEKRSPVAEATPAASDRLVLTPALRVAEDVREVATEAQPEPVQHFEPEPQNTPEPEAQATPEHNEDTAHEAMAEETHVAIDAPQSDDQSDHEDFAETAAAPSEDLPQQENNEHETPDVLVLMPESATTGLVEHAEWIEEAPQSEYRAEAEEAFEDDIPVAQAIDETAEAMHDISNAATFSAKIAALETVIGRTDDQWEPDDTGDSDYSGTEAPAMSWEDADAPAETAEAAKDEDVFGTPEDFLDEDALRDLVSDIVREELQGALGERITRNVRKLVRREIHRALAAQELE